MERVIYNDTNERLAESSQTQKELSDLKNEVNERKEKIITEQEYLKDFSYEAFFYLKWLKNAKSWDEMVKMQNPKYIVMWVQAMLKYKGYNVGEIDWVLKTNWMISSKTMEAIKQYQIDKKLNRKDGIPGPETLKSILDDLVKEHSETISDRDLLKRIKESQKEYPHDVFLSTIKLTDSQARLLWEMSKVKWWTVYIPFVESITDSQSKELWKVHRLELESLLYLTDKQAIELGNVDHLELNSLSKITNKQAEWLSKVKEYASLWLIEMSDEQAQSLSKIKSLQLFKIKKLTDNQAKSLWNVEELALGSLSSLTDNQAKELWRMKRLDFGPALTSITDKQAEYLSHLKYLWINKEILTPKQKQILKNVSIY